MAAAKKDLSRTKQVKDPRDLRGADLDVLVDELHFCIVQKPVNVVVVEGRGVPRPTLHELVIERFGKGVLPVHRLDRVTSGCTVFAKTAFGEQTIMEAFRRRHVDKRYLALVEGLPEFNKQMVDVKLLRVDNENAKRGAVAWQTVDDKGQRATTRLRVLARGKRFSVVEARPETGRMHQIRVHLAHLGFPIAGDRLYGAQIALSDEELGAHAVGLHALAISIPRPKGGRAFARAPLPGHWQRILDDEGIDVEPMLERALTKFGPKDGGKDKDGSKDGEKPGAEKAASSRRQPALGRRKGAPLAQPSPQAQRAGGRKPEAQADDQRRDGLKKRRSPSAGKGKGPFKKKSKTGVSKSKKRSPKVRSGKKKR
ncbi:MAG: RNA pseudouridine synthase [Deltaproteobacteria bacterium]|nr:RNA pseudouridine synthase [Deltaproteobacteria bacterium]